MAEMKACCLFTDREEPRAAFWEQYDSLKTAMPCPSRVLTYYGIGGIGKTSLLEKLAEEMQQHTDKPRFVEFNFEAHQESVAVLIRLKNLLQDKYRFTFPVFEVGAYLYAKKSGEDPDAIEEKLLEDRNPGVKLAMDIVGKVPGLSFVADIFSIFDKGLATFRTYQKTHPQELKELEQKNAQQLRGLLPGLFAKDLSRNLENAKTPLIFLLDTYEREVDELSSVGKPLNRDLWLRDDKGVIRNVPNTLWVIAGREKLKWDMLDAFWSNGLEQHLLGELSPADGEGFLRAAGVENEKLVRQLYILTKGTPLYLDICTRQYRQLLDQGKKPDISMFGSDVEELVERFVRYMDQTQQVFVYMLSCMRSWDDALAEEASMQILHNFNYLCYEQIKALSFVIPADEKTYHLHRTVGQILLNDRKNLLREKTANFLIMYFSGVLQKTEPHLPDYAWALENIIHGGLLLYRQTDALDEFYRKQIRTPVWELIRCGRYAQAEDAMNMLFERAEQDLLSRFYAVVLMDQAWVLQKMKTDKFGAQKLAGRAVILHTVLLGPDHPDTLEATQCLANVMNDQGDCGRALQLTRRVLDKRRAIQGDDHPSTIEVMTSYVGLLSVQGEYEAALPLQEQLVEKHRMLYQEDDIRTLKAVFNLAYTYAKLHRYAAAIPLYEWLLQKSRNRLGEAHPHTINTKSKLANLYAKQNRLADALPLQEQVLESCQKLFGEDYPDTVMAMQRLAKILQGIGRIAEGVALWEKAEEKAAGFKKKQRDESLQQMVDRVKAADVIWSSDGTLEEKSESLHRSRQNLGQDHPQTLAAMEQLAQVLCDAGQQELAFILWEQALDKRRILLGNDLLDMADSLEALIREMARFYQNDKQRYVRVVELREDLLAIYGENLEDNDVTVVKAQQELALALSHIERYEEALPLFESVVQKLVANRAEEEAIRKAMKNLESVYFDLGQYEKALSLIGQMQQKLGSQPEKNAKQIAELEWRELVILSLAERHAEAIPRWEKLLEKERTEHGGEDIFILYYLAHDYAGIGQTDKAQALRSQIEEISPGILSELDAQLRHKLSR